MSLSDVILLFLKLSIVLSVLAIGLHVTFADTAYLFRKPGLLGKALLSMYVIMPIVALVLAWSFDLHPAVKVALVTLSVSPIPPILPNRGIRSRWWQELHDRFIGSHRLVGGSDHTTNS
jgi:BASS family bile acid:Na+ symporter